MTVALTTREDLIHTLHLAAQLEHNLMCQYLFAAFSMKRSTSEGLDEVQLEKTRGWGPDPSDEPRGVSGYTFALAGEPDLDRLLHLQPDEAGVFERRFGVSDDAPGPHVGVTCAAPSCSTKRRSPKQMLPATSARASRSSRHSSSSATGSSFATTSSRSIRCACK
jgi:hypothetical protein